MIPILFASVCVGAAIYYLVKASQYWRVESRKSMIEKTRERIDYESRKLDRTSLVQTIKRRASDSGWDGDSAPLVLFAAVLYLLVYVVLGVVGLKPVVGALAAFPGSIVVVWFFRASAIGKRRRAFNRQLMQALDLFAAQLKGGLSPVRAIEQVLPSLPQPLRGEFGLALEQHRAAKSLGDALSEIQVRYPSRAMQMLVVTVRIDEERGGKMADALEQAAENVRRDFELGAEAQAELSQEKSQFYGIIIILALFTFLTLGRADPTAKAAYLSPSGLAVIVVAVSNAAFGIFRVLRVFAKAKGTL